eukprot:gnl/TRDRNA2_/TRDRNA2_91830_c1_seq1.p1 gnl/TRDRNA2_/TRDRNA2_91830_c1~~gnl/TRDRNA2_/TRDRNA2_91830_c1_seq1.p1  ORF type:complete len:454 (-),score=81.01 gnl/TRDRNA2_/TRDRNA2_91830_c1_seq1:16-1245(-)
MMPSGGGQRTLLSSTPGATSASQDEGGDDIGWASQKGVKPETENQDAWLIFREEGDFSIYALFDGHGPQGHAVADFVKELLPKLIIQDERLKNGRGQLPAVCRDAFRKMQTIIQASTMQNQLDATLSGTAATVAIHIHRENHVTMAHVSNSSCVLGKWTPDGQLGDVMLTRKHTPDLPDEQARIVEGGGCVAFDGCANHRVYTKDGRYPGLNMSRSLGDLLAHQDCGLSCDPEISEHAVEPSDHVLLLCSGGVWTFIEPDQAMLIVKGKSPQAAADSLTKEAAQRWLTLDGGLVVDDLTAFVVRLEHQKDTASSSSLPTDAEVAIGSAENITITFIMEEAGEMHDISVSTRATIGQLKHLMYNVSGVNIASLDSGPFAVINSTEVELTSAYDDRTLSDCGIRDGATIRI